MQLQMALSGALRESADGVPDMADYSLERPRQTLRLAEDYLLLNRKFTEENLHKFGLKAPGANSIV